MAPNPVASCKLTRLTEVPLALHGNLLFVQASVGDAPVTLLIDTGAERTLLTDAAVTRLGLPRDLQHATQTFGIGNPSTTWDATLPNGITLGGRDFPLPSVTVGEFEINRPANQTVDGLLGADLLLAFDADIDLLHGQLALYLPRPGCPQAAPPWQQPFIRLAGITTQGDRIMLPFELDGVTGTGVLDTGAQLSSISQQMAERVGLGDDALSADRTVMAHGAAREQVAVHFHRFSEFRVGPASMHEPLLPVVPMTEGMGDALIGADFLQGRRAWLSYSTQQVLVTPLEQGAAVAAAR